MKYKYQEIKYIGREKHFPHKPLFEYNNIGYFAYLWLKIKGYGARKILNEGEKHDRREGK